MRSALLLLSLFFVACTGVIVGPQPGIAPLPPPDAPQPGPMTPAPPPAIELPAQVKCDGMATGRSYLGFAGEALDADRLPLAAGQDTARIRDGSDLWAHYDGANIQNNSITRSDQQAFGAVNEHWYEVTRSSFAAIYRAYALAFEGCLRKVQNPANYHPFGDADYGSPPTADSAARQCQVMSHMIWGGPMSPDQLQACVEYAQEVTTLEPDVQRQWGYVCASVAASAYFLAY
jgi:hypothetical protein